MPAEPERQASDRLSQLRSDVTHVDWSDADAIRSRGEQRSRRRAAAGAVATVTVFGLVGFGLFGGQGLVEDDLAGVPHEPAVPTVTTTDSEPSPGSEEAPDAETGPDDRVALPPTGPQESPDSPGDTTDRDTEEAGPQPSEGTTAGSGDDGAAGEDEPSDPGTAEPPDPEDGTDPQEPPNVAIESVPSLVVPAAAMPRVNDSDFTWRSTGTSPDEGGTVAQCQNSTLTSLGAGSVVRRDYVWGPDGSVSGANVVGVFASTADAEAAYASLAEGVRNCTWGTPSEERLVVVSQGNASWWFMGRSTSEDMTGKVEALGLVWRGRAVSVVVHRMSGQEYYPTMEPTLVDSWERLEGV